MKLTTKILFSVGVILFVSAVIIVFYFQTYLVRQILDDFSARKINETSRYAEWVLQEDDFDPVKTNASSQRLQEFIRLLSGAEITDITLWDPSGRVVISTDKNVKEYKKGSDAGEINQVFRGKKSLLLEYKNEENRAGYLYGAFPHDFELYVPIFLNGDINGVAELHLSKIFINHISKKVALTSAIFLFFSSLLVFLLITILLDYIVIEPIRKVVDASKALRQRKWGIPLDIEKRKDEIGELASSFEYMRSSLKDVFDNLHKEKESALRAIKEADRKKKNMEDSKRAMPNVLEDFEESKNIIEKEKFKYAAERDRGEGILRYLHAIGEGVIAMDINGNIIFINLTAAKMASCAEKDFLIGKKYLEVFPFYWGRGKKKKEIDPAGEALKKNGAYVLPQDCYMITGSSKIPVAGSFAPIVKNNKTLGVVSVFQDISERYKIEKEKDDFISIAAHQLRTPLAGIRWMIESLIDGDAGELPAEAKEILGQIDENNQRLALLVNDLLDVSRINMGKSKEDQVLVDISKTAYDAVRALEGLSREREVSVTLKKISPENPRVKIGSAHLFQAFENLISNAIKYTPRNGSIEVSVDLKKDKVLVAVSDTGIGIPKKEQENIFKKFFRANNATLKETEGSGLGLNVVKSFIEEAGGKIWFESEEGKGTTFFIELAVAEQKIKI